MRKRFVGVTIAALSAVMACAGCSCDGEYSSQQTEQSAEEGTKSDANLNDTEKKIAELVEKGRQALFGLNDTEHDYEKALEYFLEAEKAGTTDSELAEVNYYIGHIYESGYGVEIDCEKAQEYLSKSAECNNGKAALALGLMYYNGYGVEMDETTARQYFQKAIDETVGNSAEGYYGWARDSYDLGYYDSALEDAMKVVDEATEPDVIAAAMLIVADVYRTGGAVEQDLAATVEWCQKAMDLNYSYAYNYMGLLYENGYGVEQSAEKAFEYYETAAEMGCADAIINVGNSYKNGFAVEQDYKKAMEYYEMAAEKKSARAMYNMAYLYMGAEYTTDDGEIYREAYEGLEMDMEKAVEWFEKSSELNYQEAMFRLGYIYYWGDKYNIEEDYEAALKWYEKAANAGHVMAMYFIGDMYENGYGVEANEDLAYEWYEMAADCGYGVAMNMVGTKKYEEATTAEEYEEALQLFVGAAQQGNVSAAYNAASMYWSCEFIEQNGTEAKKWAEFAAENENESAKILLDELEAEGY